MPERTPGPTETRRRGGALSLTRDGAVAAFILAVAGANPHFFYSRGLTNLYGDSIAHMEGARRIFDSLTPGYDEIGSVWLPLYHLLVAPLAINDSLWRTGLAGSLVSTAAFAGTAWFLYRLAAEISGNTAAGILTLGAFLLCPNLLYLASTPLTEPLALFWTVLVAYALFRYSQTGRRATLLGAGVAAFLGTLTRYDEWYVLPFAALFVLLAEPGGRPRIAPDGRDTLAATGRRRPWGRCIRHAALFTLIAGAGPALWVLHNAYRFGNPLEFYNGPFSAQAIYAHQLATTAFPYPTEGSLSRSARYYLEDIKLVIGPWALELAVLGLIAWAANYRAWRRSAVGLLFLVPLPFYIHALAYAAIPLYVPTLFPWTYYNLRYGLEMMPAVALLPSLTLSARLPRRVQYGLLVLFLAVLAAQAYTKASAGVTELPVLKEGSLNTPCRSSRQQAIVRVLRAQYDGGRVLLAAGKWPCVLPEVGIYYRQTLTDSNREYWVKLRSEPEKLVGWIVRGDGDAVDELMRAHPQAFTDFELVEKDVFASEGGVAIYRRRR
jgi:hypothetical protein